MFEDLTLEELPIIPDFESSNLKWLQNNIVKFFDFELHLPDRRSIECFARRVNPFEEALHV